MAGPGRDLAKRFQAAIAREQNERKEAEHEKERRMEEARQARETLLAELRDVLVLIGGIAVEEVDEGGLACTYDGVTVAFRPKGQGDRVEIEWRADRPSRGFTHLLYRETELGGRWVYQRQRPGQDDRWALFDAGLERILVDGLGLPEPG